MGVKLKQFTNGKKIELKELNNKTISIDAFNTLYQFLATIRGPMGEPLKNRDGEITSHLTGLFYRNINLLNSNIKPIFVFDGKPPELKKKEIERRKKIKKDAKIKYEKAVEEKDEETAKKYAQMISRIEDYMIDDSKKLLDLLGIPWVEASSEAEATAAHFTKIGKSDYTASQDYDAILFGAPNLIRNLTISGRRKVPRKNVYVNVDPEVIELKKLLEENNLSREQLIDIGILIGTDFNPNGIRGIGPVTAVKYIKKYGKLEHINELKEKIQEIEYEQIREIFLRPKITEPGDIKWNNIKKDKLVEFLCDEKGFSHDRIQNSLKKFEDAIKMRNQTLDKWFK